MKVETKIQRILKASDQMKGVISSETRRISSDLAREGQERDDVNLATFIHNAKEEMHMKKEDLNLEDVCKKLCQELDANTDDDLQTYINHAKTFLGYSRDDLITKGATHELLKTFLVIALIQEKEIAKLKLAMGV